MKAREIAANLQITDLDFDVLDMKGEEHSLHQLKRRIRYFCYAMKRKNTGENDKVRVPVKFINHYESMDQFEGWQKFAVTWDVKNERPDIIYPRTFSVEEEWNATLRRVVPELPADRIWRQGDGAKGNI